MDIKPGHGERIKNSDFSEGNVFVNYPFENVMFRWDHNEKQVWRKFYGQTNEQKIPFDNELFNQAILNGLYISEKQYNLT